MALMQGVDPELVRNNDTLRLKLHTDLAAATTTLCTMVEHRGRVFRDVVDTPEASVVS